jgi:SAM-dependent methyltransferase
MVVVNVLFVTNVITLICLSILVIYYKIPKKIIEKIAMPKYCKSRFMKIINSKGKLLDIGCGNNSPYSIKTKYPNIIYTGIDVGDYNQTKPNLADNYIITTPEQFAESIINLPELFDTIISAHNLEHCNERQKTLETIPKVLKKDGYLYLSFPTEESVNFPGPRMGTLNYYDDSTHKDMPPIFSDVIKTLKNNEMEIIFSSGSYKPFLAYVIGFLLEWKSKKNKDVIYPFTWAYWGFEAIIWARKK